MSIERIINIQQFEQRSEGWFQQRKQYLTSSDVASVMGINKYCSRNEVLFKKCGITDGFKGNAATKHGEIFEDVCIDLYCKFTGRKNTNVGLIPYTSLNDTHIIDDIDVSFLAGSSDGITTLQDGSEINVLEVKCPFYRKNIEDIPEHYYPQLQMNLHIMNIDHGDFIQYIPKGHKGSPGYMSVIRIKKDDEWFRNTIPILRSFWDDVIKYRNIGIDKHPEYDKTMKIIERKRKANEKEALKSL